MNILNLTQHQGSVEQLSQGLIEPSADNKVYIKELLTLNNVPNPETLKSMCEARAELLLELMEKAHEENDIQSFLIGGHPLLIQTLIRLNRGRFYLLGAQSNRVTVEGKDGSKLSKFQHQYFYTLANGNDIDWMNMPTVIL